LGTGKSGSWLRRRLGLNSSAGSAASTVPSSAGTAMAYEPPMDELEPDRVFAGSNLCKLTILYSLPEQQNSFVCKVETVQKVAIKSI